MNLVYTGLVIIAALGLGAALGEEASAAALPGFRVSPWWNEQALFKKTQDGVRMLFNAPADMDPKRPTLLVFYATPNGNTAEQTLGSERPEGVDWHYDIQHIAAQTRALRDRDRSRNIVLVVVEAEGKSWPAWRGRHADASARIRALVEEARKTVAPDARVALTGHSGGGSFLLGFIEGEGPIPGWVERIAFLDANYSYDDAKHADKLLDWLDGDAARNLVVLAYDDRNITLDGKPVVGPTGGTYRVTHRMLDRFRKDAPLKDSRSGDLDIWTGKDGRARFLVDRNPDNRILHTVLVETNGFLHAMTAGTPREKGIRYRGARAYTKWIQPWEPDRPVGDRAMAFPPRPADAVSGAEAMRAVQDRPLAEREAAWAEQVERGSVPESFRTFRVIETASVDARGRRHTARIAVAPDFLAVGSDADFARIPLSPGTATRLAERFGCALPTRRLSDAIHRAAELKLEPRPLTEARESVATFLRHNAMVEEQRKGRAPGLLVAGHKKDVVLTDRLAGDTRHVALYGWHYPDGAPIQPLYTGHIASYVDYSHGIRLVAREMTVDGRTMDYLDVLRDPDLRALVSDEAVPAASGAH